MSEFWNRKKFINDIKHPQKLALGSLIFIVGCIIAISLFCWNPNNIGLSLLGMITFIASIISNNILSEEHNLTKGEIRRSIVIASTFVFFGLFYMANYQEELVLLSDNFWKIYGLIIIFYFITRAIETIK